MIVASAQAKDLGRAEKWMGMMQEAAAATKNNSNSAKPQDDQKKQQPQQTPSGGKREFAGAGGSVETNVVSYNTLISACIKTGNVGRAEDLVRKMMREGPR